MTSTEITIRSVQHYMYCPHRWGLLEIDRAWAENVFVTKANLLHERVHDPERHYTARGRKVFTSVPVYNDLEVYNLYGVTDCLELTEDSQGISIDERKAPSFSHLHNTIPHHSRRRTRNPHIFSVQIPVSDLLRGTPSF